MKNGVFFALSLICLVLSGCPKGTGTNLGNSFADGFAQGYNPNAYYQQQQYQQQMQQYYNRPRTTNCRSDGIGGYSCTSY